MSRLVALLLLLASFGAVACEPLKPGTTGEVTKPEAAIAKAKAAWVSTAPKQTSAYIAKFEPYHADRKGDAWHVYGTLPYPGGTPEAEVCVADGSIRVWHGQ